MPHKTPSRRDRFSLWVVSTHRRRHRVFLIALVCGVLAGLASLVLIPAVALVVGAITMFAVYLLLVALALPSFTASFLKSRAAEADMPMAIIFGVVVVAVGVCAATLFMALNRHGADAGLEVALSIVSVLLGWFTIHTMAALHYAYEYYEPESSGDSRPARGLSFPDGVEPDGIEFLYFAYVIGVAFAVSDVQIHSRKMRNLVVIHSTFAYFFNTLILAATVNVAVAVGS